MNSLNFRRHTQAGTCLALVLALFFSSNAVVAQDVPSYPREVQLPGGTVTVHHPTVSDWKDFSVLSAWVPVEIQPAGSASPWTGSVMVQAVTDIRFEERVVQLSKLRPVKAVADDSMPEAEASLKSSPGAYPLLLEALQQARQTISLDYLLRALPADFADTLPQPAPLTQQDVPDIIITEQPAVLVLFDGPPQTAPIQRSQLEIVVNTQWAIFHDTQSKLWYLVFGEYWLQNTSLSGGTWQVASQLPADIGNLAMANGWESMKKILPPRQTDRAPPPLKLSYEPAELVVFDGAPDLQQLPGTKLNFVANTGHDLFQYENRWYLLLAGRWFSARDLQGQWSFEQRLPDAFSAIPADSEKAHVLAAVPGTEENRIALVEAALPRSRQVDSSDASGISVRYDGEPEFTWINGVLLERAVNTDSQVLRHNDNYYLLEDAAWYVSSGPTGPWRAALQVPDVVYSIPPDDPAYNMTFVKLGGFDNNTGRQAYIHTYGYSGTHTADKGLIKGYGPTGSGKYYDPTYDPRERDPFFWNSFGYGGYWPPYGYGARYYPWAGGWRYGGWYDPFWGYPYPYPMTYSTTTITLPNDQQDDDSQWYSDSDGNLYRMGDGGWQIRQDKRWVPLNGPVPESVQREYQARSAGYINYERYQQDGRRGES